MRKIILNKLEVKNFKGQPMKTVEFTDETTLLGDNATGKTTIGADAMAWLFFGKNSADESKFNVKTLDSEGKRIPNVETSVKGFFTINGSEEVFERLLTEKWVKKHGEVGKEYTGDETTYFINAAPKKKKEFDIEVNNIVSPVLFKLLSNPLEFNRLHWEKRRETLVNMVGEVDTDKVLDLIVTVQNKGDYNGLINILNSGKTLETHKSELKGKIIMHEKALNDIPNRIDENQRNKPDVLNWIDLMAQLETKNNRVVVIDTLMQDEAKKVSAKSQEQRNTQKTIGEKQLELQKLENELTLEANKEVLKLNTEKVKLESDLKTLKDSVKTNSDFIDSSVIDLKKLESEKAALIKEWSEIGSRKFEFDESKSICPTCEQSLPESDIEESKNKLLGNFNETKANDLESNLIKGKAKAKLITDLEKCIDDSIKANEVIAKEYPELKEKADSMVITEKAVDFSMEKDWNDLQKEIDTLKLSISKPIEVNSNSELIIEKSEISESVKQLEKQFNTKEEIEKADKRIEELQAKQVELAQMIADLQKDESIVLKFEKTKMNMLEEKVNSLFELVKFRMFEPQKNGGEKADCVTLINGVPYSDANTASKINAGVDIINVLSEYYKIFVPIIVDNRESVTELLPVKSQIINLFKDENHKTLTVK